MSNKRDRRRGPSEPSAKPAERPKRPAASGLDLFPPMRHSLAHGLAASTGSLWFLLFILVLVPGTWVALRAMGMEVFPPTMVQVLSIPPVSSSFDLVLTTNLFTGWGGIVFILALTVIRALVWGILVGLLDEALEYRSMSRLGILRGLNAFRAMLLYCYVSMGIMIFGSLVASTLGPGIGSSASIFALVGALTFLGFAPAVAVRTGVPGVESLQRSIRGARLPGWPKQMMLAVVYFFLIAIVIPGFGSTFPLVTANPPLGEMVFVLTGTLLNVVFLAAFVDRWRMIEDDVEPTPPRR